MRVGVVIGVGVGVGVAVGVEAIVFEGVEYPGGVEAEVDANVAVLLVGGGVEVGAEADDADGAGLEPPESIELVGGAGCGRDVGGPEVPAHLELVGEVVMELLGGLGDGVFDDGVFGVAGFGGTFVVDEDALVGGGFGEADGVDGGDGDSLVFLAADKGELAEDADERGREGLEAEVGKPETEVELIGH